MEEYTTIVYRLNKSVRPSLVLQTIEELMRNYGLHYQNCLFDMRVTINEFEFEGVLHSNRRRNAVLSICKKYPDLEAFFAYSKEDQGEGNFYEDFSIRNFSEIDYAPQKTAEYAVIRDVVEKIPRPYAVNSLELIFSGTHVAEDRNADGIRPSQSGFGPPVGNYILYNREVFGDEKHSYISFSADHKNIEELRKLFFDFAQSVPGRYEGVNIQV